MEFATIKDYSAALVKQSEWFEKNYETMEQSEMDRYFGNSSAESIARALSLMSDPSIARALSLMSGPSIDRALSLMSGPSIDRANKILSMKIPIVEDIDRKIYDAVTGGGKEKLDMGDWHKCETTHCRFGWAVHLAGPEGYRLEKLVGSAERAGHLIYTVSRPGIPAPDAYATTEKAMEDIKRCAGVE